MSFVSDLTDTFLEEVAIIFLLTILVILLGVPASSLTPFLFYQNDSAEAHISPRCSHTHTHRTPPGRGLCPQLSGLPSAGVLKPHATDGSQVHEDQYFGFLALSPAASTNLGSQ